jgi:hypothetical protein
MAKNSEPSSFRVPFSLRHWIPASQLFPFFRTEWRARRGYLFFDPRISSFSDSRGNGKVCPLRRSRLTRTADANENGFHGSLLLEIRILNPCFSSARLRLCFALSTFTVSGCRTLSFSRLIYLRLVTRVIGYHPRKNKRMWEITKSVLDANPLASSTILKKLLEV